MTDPDSDEWWPQEPAPFGSPREAYLLAEREVRQITADLGVGGPGAALQRAAELAAAREDLVDQYRSTIAAARVELAGVAAETGLARLDALSGAPPGDPAAAAAADLADFRGQVEAGQVAERTERQVGDVAAGHGAALGGLMPLAMGGGGFAGGLGSSEPGGGTRSVSLSVPASADGELDHRLRELYATLPTPAREWTRLAAADVVDDSGRLWRLIGTTELDGYLRPGVALRDDELAAGNESWPELSIATFCASRGLEPGQLVGADLPPPEVCEHLRSMGFSPTWVPDAARGASFEGDDASIS